jgi:hypothetical protein
MPSEPTPSAFMSAFFRIRPIREAIVQIFLQRFDKLSEAEWNKYLALAQKNGLKLEPDIRERLRKSLEVRVPEGFVERLKSPITYISTGTGLLVGLTQTLSPVLYLPLSVLLTAASPKLERGVILGPRWLARMSIFFSIAAITLLYFVISLPLRLFHSYHDTIGISLEPKYPPVA